MPLLAEIAFERLKNASIFSKHCGFREEQEWRVVYRPERDPNGIMKKYFGYHNGPGGLEPKLKLKIEPFHELSASDLSLLKLIHSIIIGPSRHSPLNAGTVERMLEEADKQALIPKTKVSGIPYRSRS